MVSCRFKVFVFVGRFKMSETNSKSVKEAFARICACEFAQVPPSIVDVSRLAEWNAQIVAPEPAKLLALNCTYEKANN